MTKSWDEDAVARLLNSCRSPLLQDRKQAAGASECDGGLGDLEGRIAATKWLMTYTASCVDILEGNHAMVRTLSKQLRSNLREGALLVIEVISKFYGHYGPVAYLWFPILAG